jgi:hypothetical protein
MLKEDWFVVPDGHIYPVMLRKGDILSGVMLEQARELGLIEEETRAPANKAARKVPEKK